MTTNPLQQFFRQPKTFISLPSMGIYSRPDFIDGDAENIPVYGMTGMDEILMKTPDALLSGESTVRIIKSCCPTIKDGWEVSAIDIDLILTAIRIATYGHEMDITNRCTNCNAESDFTIDLNKMISHFGKFKYKNKLIIGDLTIKLRPLTYKETTHFAIVNHGIQQQLIMAKSIEDIDEQRKLISELFTKAGAMQNDIYCASIESVAINDQVVDNKDFIKEWIDNCDQDVFSKIKTIFNENKQSITSPTFDIECSKCKYKSSISVDMDQSNFFGTA